MKKTRPLDQLKRATLLAMAVCLSACQASDDNGNGRELNVITSGGFTAAYNILAPQFEKETGITLLTQFGASSGGAANSIPVRLERGEQFDLIILSQPSLNNLNEIGRVRPDSLRDLARSSIGMAVKEGAAVPDISTPDRFIEVLLEAESIGYSASASGTYLSTVLFPEIGIWEEIKEKGTRVVSERVGAVVARGDVEIGFQQVSEILPIEGITFVGRIPTELQKITTYSAGITTTASNPGDAELLIEFFSSVEFADTIAATGLDPIVPGN
jgi:molybdate transport system substrate-binding protein